MTFVNKCIHCYKTTCPNRGSTQKHFTNRANEHRAYMLSLMSFCYCKTTNLYCGITAEMLFMWNFIPKFPPKILGNRRIRNFVIQQTKISNSFVVILQNKCIGNKFFVEETGIFKKKAIQHFVSAIEWLYGFNILYP